MSCNKEQNNAVFFSKIDEVPLHIWAQLECTNNRYFDPAFLNAYQKNHPNILFSYLVLLDETGSAKAFSTIQIINFNINVIKNDFEILKKLGKKFHLLKENKPLQLLISGNTFVSGEHGVFIKKGLNKKVVIKEIAKAILAFTNANKNLNIDAFLMKDFLNESLIITDELKDYKYHPFSVEPNMVLSIDPNWQNFSDYLAAMKTKFRVKAKKAFKQSEELKIEDITLQNIESLLPKMKLLYKSVTINSSFNLSDFNLETYQALKEEFNEAYLLKAFYLDEKLVGYMSGIINNNSLDAHFVGIDYSLNRTYAIYQKMLYHYIEIGIDKKLNMINFGRTASEIKSSVGAVPQNLTMYLRHKKNIKNKILKLFLHRIQPTPFQQKFPFKKQH